MDTFNYGVKLMITINNCDLARNSKQLLTTKCFGISFYEIERKARNSPKMISMQFTTFGFGSHHKFWLRIDIISSLWISNKCVQ